MRLRGAAAAGFVLPCALVGLAAPASADFAGSDRARAVHYTAVEWARELQAEDVRGACRETVDVLTGVCRHLAIPVPDCAADRDGPPPPTPARRPREQIGGMSFDDGKARVRLRPERLKRPIRGWLILRQIEGRWRIAVGRMEGRRIDHPYGVRDGTWFFYRFFLGYCTEGDYGRR